MTSSSIKAYSQFSSSAFSSWNVTKLWRVEDGQLLHTFTGQKDYVSSVVFSPNSQVLAAGSYDSTIKLWRVDDGTILPPILEHKPIVIGTEQGQEQDAVE